MDQAAVANPTAQSQLTAVFRGVGPDVVSPSGPSPDGQPDYWISLEGVAGPITQVKITSDTGLWVDPRNSTNWGIVKSGVTGSTANLHFSQYPSTSFHVQVWYANGGFDEADASQSAPPTTLTAVFRGIGPDVVSHGTVAPDGEPDYRMTLGGLRGAPTEITITSDSNGVWRIPYNGSNWLIRFSSQSSSTGEVNFSQYASQNFVVRVAYADGSTDQANSTSALAVDDGEVARFLYQATFGPTPALIEQVKQSGIETHIDQQHSAPMQSYPDLAFWPQTRPATCIDTCQRDNYTYYQLQTHFFTNALTGEDQLRQRMAFALSQILVTSQVDVPMPAWMRSYQQLLYSGALGNYRQLLYNVTLHPTMGRFLDMAGSRCQRRNPIDVNICRNGLTSQPNENYAREILQLFSVGTYVLDENGNRVLDASGNPIPMYDQTTVEEFSRVFTGWILAPNLPSPPEVGDATLTVPNYRDPMVQRKDSLNREEYHDRGSKTLLNGIVLVAGQTAEKDLNDAIDNIAYHPNVAPFISRQLIQHLVTSNPSSAYVRRISDVFTVNSRAQDQLHQVVRAILLDPEARNGHQDPTTASTFGKLMEPALLITNILRSFGATSDGVLNSLNIGGSLMGAAEMNQDIFNPASVFNYFPPTARVPGESAFGPEYAIFSSLSALRRDNFIYRVIFLTIPVAAPNRPIGTSIDLAPYDALAATPDQLLDKLNILLLAGSMSAEMRSSIRTAVLTIPSTNPRLRVRTAVYLILTSSQYQVGR